ncbi:hypothetical protein [Methyloterricola oryzae]|uniref:hypothetical protein n=1 Tax=Methyloterricola oryzae TaxID=1495050 RepID=UPI0005EBD61F|nr:hypothetical protein [Methyloterricola oryzae]
MLNYVEDALPAFALTWRIVRKEAKWLDKSRFRLFWRVIDADWVAKAEQDDEMAERVEEFAEALNAVNDYSGQLLMPRRRNQRSMVDIEIDEARLE